MKPFQIVLVIITSVSLLTGFKKNSHLKRTIQTAAYEIKFTHTGYTLIHGTLEDCPIRSNGKVILKGTLSGPENLDPEDPAFYTGVLDLDIDMDICSVKRVAGEDKICGMTVRGSGKVNVELEIDPDGRGGYIKFKYDSTHGSFQKSVGGTCDQPQQAEEEYMVPNETIASIFNGRDLPMITSRTLRVGAYTPEWDGKNKTEVEVIRKIR